MSSGASNTTAHNGGHLGWVPQSNDRATLDIIISCAVTTFLCIWTSVCVNVPAPGKAQRDIFRDRWHMFCLGMLGPEFILLSAVGQYCCAKDSSRKFKELGHSKWSMKHSYFADMGGLHMTFPDSKSFPVNASQLHYLVAKEYMPFPSELTLEVIKDKNKRDGLSRFISTVQMCWFTLTTISRPIKHVATTTLEITTLGYILCAVPTLFFWRHRPMDILFPMTVACPVPLEKILSDHARTPNTYYRSTPLDFISREDWIGSQLWVYYVNILRRMRVVLLRTREKPAQRFSSFNFAILTRPMLFLMLLMVFIYGSLFVSAWNFYYPSNVEKLLWRTSSLGTLIIVVLGGVFEVLFLFSEPTRKSRGPQDLERVDPSLARARPLRKVRSTRIEEVLSKIRNNDQEEDPGLEIPIRSLIFTTPLCALYTLFRVFILLEDIISLRELPASAYVGITWSMYIPHV